MDSPNLAQTQRLLDVLAECFGDAPSDPVPVSNEAMCRVLAPLSSRQRDELCAAMGEVERLLKACLVRFTIESPDSEDVRWCFQQFFSELNARLNTGFDPSRSPSAEIHELTEPNGVLILARLRGEPLGTVALKFQDSSSAILKRMWISPAARGLGLGRRLIGEVEAYARRHGFTRIRLETSRFLDEAIELYRRSGYREVEAFSTDPYADYWFEKTL